MDKMQRLKEGQYNMFLQDVKVKKRMSPQFMMENNGRFEVDGTYSNTKKTNDVSSVRNERDSVRSEDKKSFVSEGNNKHNMKNCTFNMINSSRNNAYKMTGDSNAYYTKQLSNSKNANVNDKLKEYHEKKLKQEKVNNNHYNTNESKSCNSSISELEIPENLKTNQYINTNNSNNSTQKQQQNNIGNQQYIYSIVADYQRIYQNKNNNNNQGHKSNREVTVNNYETPSKNGSLINKEANGIPTTPQSVIHNSKSKKSNYNKNSNNKYNNSSRKEYSFESEKSSQMETMKGIEIDTNLVNNENDESKIFNKEGSTPRFKNNLNKDSPIENTPNVKRNLFNYKEEDNIDNNEEKKEIDIQTGFSFKKKDIHNNIESEKVVMNTNSSNKLLNTAEMNGSKCFYKTFGKSFEKNEGNRNGNNNCDRGDELSKRYGNGSESNNFINEKKKSLLDSKENIPVNNSTNLSSWNKELKQSNCDSNINESKVEYSNNNYNKCEIGSPTFVKNSVSSIDHKKPNNSNSKDPSVNFLDNNKTSEFSSKFRKIYNVKKSFDSRRSVEKISSNNEPPNNLAVRRTNTATIQSSTTSDNNKLGNSINNPTKPINTSIESANQIKRKSLGYKNKNKMLASSRNTNTNNTDMSQKYNPMNNQNSYSSYNSSNEQPVKGS